MAEEIQYRLLKAKDENQVRAFLHETFFGPEGEPITKCLKLEHPKETSCFVDAIMPHALADGVSVVAVLPDTGKVVGICLSTVMSQDNLKEIKVPSDDPDTRKMWITLNVLGQLCQGVDIFQQYQAVSYVNVWTIGVHPEYRGHGMAGELAETALNASTEKGLHLAVVAATNNYSRRICDKMGFEMLKELQYKDCLVDGEQMLWDMGEHQSQSLHVLRC